MIFMIHTSRLMPDYSVPTRSMPYQDSHPGSLSHVQEETPTRRNPLPLLRQSRVNQDFFGDRTESQESQDSHSSGDTLVLPAVTVSLPPGGRGPSPSGGARGSLSAGSSLQSQNSQDSGVGVSLRPSCSLQVPANRIRNALMVRGRRASVMHFAESENVVNKPMVSAIPFISN